MEPIDYKFYVKSVVCCAICVKATAGKYIIVFELANDTCDTSKTYIRSSIRKYLGEGKNEYHAWRNAYMKLKHLQ